MSVISLSKIDTNALKWQINAFVNDYNYIYQGIFSRLLNYFIKNYYPKEINVIVDVRWILNKDDNIFTKCGFIIKNELSPTYDYVLSSNPTKRIKPCDIILDNNKKYSKIWNCGYYEYQWNNKEN